MTDHPPVVDRLCYVLVAAVTTSGYHDGSNRKRVETVAEATLVSSRTRSGLHAPALDIDHRAALTVHGPRRVLWIEGLNIRQWRGIRRTLHGARLGGRLPSDLRHLGRYVGPDARRDAYAAARGATVDETSRMLVLRNLGPHLKATFAETLEVATGSIRPVGTDPDAANLTAGPDLAAPWPVPLAAPAMLLPSTKNHHLYVDATLSWAAYRRTLRGLGRYGLLEPGYVGASMSRQATHLRLPWISKHDNLYRNERPF